MRRNAGKIGILVLLASVLPGLGGCLMGDSVDEPSGASSPPPPPPPTGNGAPTISGNPASAVTVGNQYTFTPNASDPDGDTLTFSVENLPNWATFDPASGEVSGVANLGTEGDYTNIRITVSDGSLSASLPSFNINVTQASLGSATLSWSAPTQNTDGTPLANLAAYKIYWGTQPGIYPNQVRIDNPGTTTYVVENLTPNTYRFVATAVNGNGVESVFSNVATKVVN